MLRIKDKLSLKNLYKAYWFINLFGYLITIVLIVFLCCYWNSLLDQGTLIGVICIVIIAVSALILLYSCIKNSIPLIKDWNDFRNDHFSIIEGVVVGFEKNREPESGIQIDDTPIIETAKKQHISLNVGSFLEKGKYYTFYYYKNSRIAKAVEKKAE